MPYGRPLSGKMGELIAGLRDVFERPLKIVQTPRFRLSVFSRSAGAAVQISRFPQSDPI